MTLTLGSVARALVLLAALVLVVADVSDMFDITHMNDDEHEASESHLSNAHVEWNKLNAVVGMDAIKGNLFRLRNDPLEHFSIHVAPHGCGDRRGVGFAPASEIARQHNCVAAINAGFFDSITYECVGDVTSMNTPMHASEHPSLKFGITTNREYVIGYLQDEDIHRHETLHKDHIAQLISGKVWLVRDGKNYVSQSLAYEHAAADEIESHTGFNSLEEFSDALIARSAIGHDAEGHLMMISIDGDGVGVFKASGSPGVNTDRPGSGLNPESKSKLLELAERRAMQHKLEQQLISFRTHAANEPANAQQYNVQAENTEKELVWVTTQICLLQSQVKGNEGSNADVKCVYGVYNSTTGHRTGEPSPDIPTLPPHTNVVFDGTHRRQAGLDLPRFADMLIQLGFVNAVNLDGGSSATAVVNGSLVSSPTEQCEATSVVSEQRQLHACEREIVSIACFHHRKHSPIFYEVQDFLEERLEAEEWEMSTIVLGIFGTMFFIVALLLSRCALPVMKQAAQRHQEHHPNSNVCSILAALWRAGDSNAPQPPGPRHNNSALNNNFNTVPDDSVDTPSSSWISAISRSYSGMQVPSLKLWGDKSNEQSAAEPDTPGDEEAPIKEIQRPKPSAVLASQRSRTSSTSSDGTRALVKTVNRTGPSPQASARSYWSSSADDADDEEFGDFSKLEKELDDAASFVTEKETSKSRGKAPLHSLNIKAMQR